MIGYHISKNGRSLPVAIQQELTKLRNMGIETPCGQIFVTGPRSSRCTLTQIEMKQIEKLGAKLVIHGAYIDAPWGDSADKAIENIAHELTIANEIGATGVVVHLGAGAIHMDKIQKLLETIGDTKNAILWFEINAAKSSSSSFETVDKLAAFFDKVRAVKPENVKVGLCIDTAHLFACGVALVTYEDAAGWLDDLVVRLEATVDNFMVHLNDCKTERGSGKDIHAPIGRGNIWKGIAPKETGAALFINWCNEHGQLCIIERDMDEIEHDFAAIKEIMDL